MIFINVPRDPGSQDPSFVRVCADHACETKHNNDKTGALEFFNWGKYDHKNTQTRPQKHTNTIAFTFFSQEMQNNTWVGI